MPDPNAHADDMKSPAKPETMPSLWWLSPWTFAIEQWQARAKFYAYWQKCQKSLADAGADCYAQANHIIALNKELEAERKKTHDFEQRWLETNEALTKEQGDHDETKERLEAVKAEAEGHREATKAAHKVIDDIYDIVPGKAHNADGLIENIRLLIPKPKAKKKGGKR
jgi:hypothetical protein